MKFNDARFVIAYTIILLFTGAYIYQPSETMTGALIAAFAGAWGYYLGSSSGAAKQADNAAKALDLAVATAPPPPPAPVVVTNPDSDPVPVATPKE